MLLYPYTEAFLLRFPMLYLAFYVISLFLETVRVITQRELISMEKKYQTLYKRDALTGIYNRYGFEEKIDEILADATISSFSMALVDIDYFKKINDEFGHVNGDFVLCYVANLLKDTVGSNGHVCRWGGEEFAVLFTQGQNTAAFCETMLRRVADYDIAIENSLAKITISIGTITTHDKSTFVQKDFIRQADDALYEAKVLGRNRAVHKEI